MKKQCAALLLAVLLCTLLSALLIGTVSASDERYTADNGIMYALSSDGNAYVLDGKSTTGNVEVAASVTIGGEERPVTAVGSYAFEGSTMTSLKIPSTIRNIYDYALSNCFSLESVNFSGAACSIGNYVFAGSTGFKSMTSATAVRYVGRGALDGTKWYDNYRAKTDAVVFGKVLYRYCGTGTDVTVKSGLLAVAPDAFRDNKTLKSVTLPTSLVTIGDSAFDGCTALSSVNLPSSLTSIGNAAFFGCSKLGSLAFPASIASIGTYAFSGCSSFTEVDLSEAALSLIERGAFADCTKLSSVVLPEGLTSIGDFAFTNCPALTGVVGGSLTTIGYDAFRNDGAFMLSSAFDGVTSVGTGAFFRTAWTDSCDYPLIVGKVLYLDISADSTLLLDDGIKTVAPYALYGKTTLSTLVLPMTVTSVGEAAMKTLKSVDTTVIFSREKQPYEAFTGLTNGTVYTARDDVSSNFAVKTYAIRGIKVKTMPKKMSYKPEDAFDPAGLELVLDTENGLIGVSDFGIEPEYTYDFSKNGSVTITYEGYTTSLTVTLGERIPGDANGDGVVTNRDASRILQYLAHWPVEINLGNADCNGDGVVTNRDASRILQSLAHWPVEMK